MIVRMRAEYCDQWQVMKPKDLRQKLEYSELIILSTQPVEHINFSRKCQGRFPIEVTNFFWIDTIYRYCDKNGRIVVSPDKKIETITSFLDFSSTISSTLESITNSLLHFQDFVYVLLLEAAGPSKEPLMQMTKSIDQVPSA